LPWICRWITVWPDSPKSALVLQIGGMQIEPVTRRLQRVRPGSDEPSVLDAIRHAGGRLDGTRRFFWVDAFKLRQLEAELRGER
jgi:hypothetical protein